MRARLRIVASPLGPVRLVAQDGALTGVYYLEHRHAPLLLVDEGEDPVLDQAARELDEYFAGRRTRFDTPLAPRGTDFQRSVWLALAAIPFGERRSYADLAGTLGRPNAVRAVGAANGKNPLSIFLPCHRVVGSSGALTGYAAGLPAKRWLLDHETRVIPSIHAGESAS